MVRQTWDPLAFIWPMRGHFSALWSAPSLETMMSSNLSGQTTWRFLDRKIDQNPVAVCRWRCVRGVRRALHVDWLMDFCLRCSGLWKCVSAQVRNDPEIYAHGESLTVLWEDLQKVSKGRPSILRRLQLRPKPGSAADDGWINVNAVCAISSLCNPPSEDPKYPLKCWFCLSTLSFEAMLSA